MCLVYGGPANYRFRLTPSTGTSTVATTTINLNFIQGVDASDILVAKLYEDSNSDGATTSETQIGSNGDIVVSGSGGYINFATSTTYDVSEGTDFIVELAVNNLTYHDNLTLGYGGPGLDVTDVCGAEQPVLGTPAYAAHSISSASYRFSPGGFFRFLGKILFD